MSLPYPIERQREAERKWRRRFEQAARARQNAYRHAVPPGVLADCPVCGSAVASASPEGGLRRWACTSCGHTWPRAVQLAS